MSRIGIALLIVSSFVPSSAKAQEDSVKPQDTAKPQDTTKPEVAAENQDPQETAKPQKPLSKEQIAAIGQKADKLAEAKKLREARVAYQKIIAAIPNSSAATRARVAIARIHLAEGRSLLAVKFLESELEGNPNLPLAEVAALRANAGLMVLEHSRVLGKSGKLDEANEVLDQILEREGTSGSLARWVLIQKAQNYFMAKRSRDAVAVYHQLLKRSEASDSERLQDIVALTAIAPQEVKVYQEFIDERPAAEATILAKARYEMARTYRKLDNERLAFTILDEMIAAKTKTPERWIGLALVEKAEIFLEQGDEPRTLSLYRAALDRPWRPGVLASDRLAAIHRLLDLDSDEDVSGDVANLMSHVTDLSDVNLGNAAPVNDVLAMGAHDATTASILMRYKRHLRATAGRATKGQLDTIAAQLNQGGDARPFVVSKLSKRVAEQISADAPLGEYLKPLLSGNHQLAAQVAWRRARLARDESTLR